MFDRKNLLKFMIKTTALDGKYHIYKLTSLTFRYASLPDALRSTTSPTSSGDNGLKTNQA